MGSLPCWLLQEATLLSFHTLLPLYLALQGTCTDEISSLNTYGSSLKSSRRIGFQLVQVWPISRGVTVLSISWYCGVSMLFRTLTVSNASGHKVLGFFQPQQSRALGSENYIYRRPVRAHHPLCPAQSYRSSSRAKVVKEHQVITPIKSILQKHFDFLVLRNE